jgi:hypothetical protein
MIDYSFLRLKDNISDALNIGDSPVTTHFFYNPIQLLPNKSYLQITNFQGGISLDSDCEVFVVDCSDNVLADITENTFIEEFIDSNGNNQCKIEFVNLGVDFYRETVLIKFKMLSSNAEFWTNPINITSYQSERTVFFKYKNYDDFMGIGYTNANVSQSISLSMYFDIPIDDTETEDYFQISRNNTISARALQKLFEQYKIEQINRFTFDRLNVLLKHEIIYLDGIRVTNKPVVSSSERLGDSNYFETDVIVAKNYNDAKLYDFQIYEGLQYVGFAPQGLYITSTSFASLKASFSEAITINSGTITVYDSTDTVVETFTESDMSIVGSSVDIDLTGTSLENPINNTYYVHVSGGLVTGVIGGQDNEEINDSVTWSFELRDADFLGTDFNNSDFFTN